MKASPSPIAVAMVPRFVTILALLTTAAMVLFPPFSSLNGTEYAFMLSGPEWARRMGPLGEDLGLTAAVDWLLLTVQLVAVWAIAVSIRWLLIQPSAAA